MEGIRRRITFSNVIALLALFIALGSGAYAVTRAPKNSVTTKSIKNGQVKKADIGKDAVTGAKVKEGTLGPVPQALNATKASSADLAQRAAVAGQRFEALNILSTDPPSPGRNAAQPRLVLSTGEIEVRVGCAQRGGNGSAVLSLTSSTAASIAFSFLRDDNADSASNLNGQVRDGVNAGGTLNVEASSVGGNNVVMDTTALVRAERQTYAVIANLRANPGVAGTCSVYGIVTQAG